MDGVTVTFTGHGLNLQDRAIHGDYDDPEEIVRKLLEDYFGFNTLNIEPGELPYVDMEGRLIDELEKIYCQSKYSDRTYNDRGRNHSEIYEKGVPDFVVWKVDSTGVYHDIGFVEVKGLNDSIQTSQGKWFAKYPMFDSAIAQIEER